MNGRTMSSRPTYTSSGLVFLILPRYAFQSVFGSKLFNRILPVLCLSLMRNFDFTCITTLSPLHNELNIAEFCRWMHRFFKPMWSCRACLPFPNGAGWAAAGFERSDKQCITTLIFRDPFRGLNIFSARCLSSVIGCQRHMGAGLILFFFQRYWKWRMAGLEPTDLRVRSCRKSCVDNYARAIVEAISAWVKCESPPVLRWSRYFLYRR